VFGLKGQVLDGQYRVGNVLGEGGFGVVYEGWHIVFEHALAIKCLKLPMRGSSVSTETFWRKFREEGALMSRLAEHPSITRVFAFGVTPSATQQAVPYLVLEKLEGRTLGEQMMAQDRAYSEKEALAILLVIADAVAFAHEQRIAHRDIKPANIFFAQTLRGPIIKLLDFGIAKVFEDVVPNSPFGSAVTQGPCSFSPAYGTPEQFRPKEYGGTGPWTDVYALGLLLTELMTGRRPYENDDILGLMQEALAQDRPTPRKKGAHISQELESICEVALAVDPRHRFPHARAMHSALVNAQSRLNDQKDSGNSTLPRQLMVMENNKPQSSLAYNQTITSDYSYKSPSTTNNVFLTPHAESGPQSTSKKGHSRYKILFGIAVIGTLFAFFLVIGVISVWKYKQMEEQERFQAGNNVPPKPSSSKATKKVESLQNFPVTDQVTGEMVAIPAGKYWMGSNDSSSQKPIHPVSVSAFYLDRTEVTVEAFSLCVRAKACQAAEVGEKCNWEEPDKQKHPINCVNWSHANSFCLWAKKRLPTEEEWEYAARGSDGRKHVWGNSPPAGQLCWDGEGNSKGKSQRKSTCEVGSFSATAAPFPVHDLAGNVFEWTASVYRPNYKAHPKEKYYAVRGGSWYNSNPNSVTATNRLGNKAKDAFFDTGFRCAR
jgi:eukaryotic-like serine/threonine-protein kinase